ncbi:syndecan-2-A-like [Pholidichthys leucotaenia]
MSNVCWLFLVGLTTALLFEKLLVSSQSLTTADDLYLEGRPSGDFPIDDEDGEDDNGSGSGSGSGDNTFGDISDTVSGFLNFTFLEKLPTTVSPQNPPTTAAGSQDPETTVKDGETTLLIFPVGNDRDDEVPVTGTTAGWFTENISPSSTNTPLRETTKLNIDFSVTTTVAEVPSTVAENKILTKTGLDRRLQINQPQEVFSENLWERTDVLAAVIACGVVGFVCAVFLLLLLAYRMKKKDEGSYELGDTKLSVTAYHKAPTQEFYA